jgi:hypothetical protein
MKKNQKVENCHIAKKVPKRLFCIGNCKVYKARQVREMIDECGFIEIEHPPCSPDLAHYLFPKLKKKHERIFFRMNTRQKG